MTLKIVIVNKMVDKFIQTELEGNKLGFNIKTYLFVNFGKVIGKGIFDGDLSSELVSEIPEKLGLKKGYVSKYQQYVTYNGMVMECNIKNNKRHVYKQETTRYLNIADKEGDLHLSIRKYPNCKDEIFPSKLKYHSSNLIEKTEYKIDHNTSLEIINDQNSNQIYFKVILPISKSRTQTLIALIKQISQIIKLAELSANTISFVGATSLTGT